MAYEVMEVHAKGSEAVHVLWDFDAQAVYRWCVMEAFEKSKELLLNTSACMLRNDEAARVHPHDYHGWEEANSVHIERFLASPDLEHDGFCALASQGGGCEGGNEHGAFAFADCSNGIRQ